MKPTVRNIQEKLLVSLVVQTDTYSTTGHRE